MQYRKLGECAKITFCSITPSRSKTQTASSKWLVCANFLADNEVVNNPTVNNMVPDSEWLLHKNDIVIKRITPAFVNYIDFEPNETYCSNNLIIVTPNTETDSKYLAMILNDRIRELSKESSIGAVMKSISRSDIELLEIPMLNEHERQLIGELWYKSIELKKKKNKLIELEHTRTNHLIKRIIQISGGTNNG
ncbi:restriction endonuclease subunit S [uncultured Ruminococcus sp.]|uniref:restriction endonuclease subunit S n=1 Tax=uncultured Ruminococcus sp. TaxID=165186 RepID=UPI0025F549B5|nr:restriction endonuclease subunit S [uncultured Ruminococcus sp.]